jgi:predicted nuclease of predicted toxin-antitoxin system
MASASDGEIWRFAQENGFVVISKDEDFFFLASRATSETQFVWIRLGNCRTSRLLTAIGAIWERVEARLQAGDQIVEIR